MYIVSINARDRHMQTRTIGSRTEIVAVVGVSFLLLCLIGVAVNLMGSHASPATARAASPTVAVATATTVAPTARPQPTSAARDVGSAPSVGATIEYTVYGDSGSVEVAYVNGANAVDSVDGPDLPWSRAQYMSSGRRLMVTARNVTTEAPLTCEIAIDGVVVQRMTSEGSGALAICSAMVP